MRITEQLVDQAFADLKSKCGGIRNDYFGLLYLQHEHDVPREDAIDQVAFGGHDWLSAIATTRVRFILKDLIEDKQFAAKAAEGKFDFLRTNAAYKRAMEFAHKRFKWVGRGLK